MIPCHLDSVEFIEFCSLSDDQTNNRHLHMKGANLCDSQSQSCKSVIGTAGDHPALSLLRLDTFPVAKVPDSSSALVIFEFKTLCFIMKLWKLYSNS